jgi:hypothetical protein
LIIKRNGTAALKFNTLLKKNEGKNGNQQGDFLGNKTICLREFTNVLQQFTLSVLHHQSIFCRANSNSLEDLLPTW